ncbi:MAG TPA: FliM/FliN family flagellar motor switch protein [Silvibacterium sp.]|nr:FliM/FliN family flagellar motor switch protein [Silvibacterium sp.]
MKTFLATWLLEAPAILRREFSNRVELVPADQLPAPATAINFAVLMGGGASGRFTITADPVALHHLFVEAGVTESEPDGRRDYELWWGVLHQTAIHVAQAFGGAQVTSIEDAKWSPGLPSAAYELRLGDVKMQLAFTDEVLPKADTEVLETTPRTGDTMTLGKDGQRGIDLLLDVELEASLRFGSCEMSLNEVLELGPGDVVELDRHVADPVDLLVGDKIVARGEVVLVNGSLGLRVMEVAEPKKCLESIRCLF